MSTENDCEKDEAKALSQDAVSGSAYFTEAEIENFKKGSLSFSFNCL